MAIECCRCGFRTPWQEQLASCTRKKTHSRSYCDDDDTAHGLSAMKVRIFIRCTNASSINKFIEQAMHVVLPYNYIRGRGHIGKAPIFIVFCGEESVGSVDCAQRPYATMLPSSARSRELFFFFFEARYLSRPSQPFSLVDRHP